MHRTVVCLCGSTRFKEAFEEANKRETLSGNIVLSVGFFVHSDTSATITSHEKALLDCLHIDKILMCDEVLILNVDGYIGNSTFNELKCAYGLGKVVRFLEPDNIPDRCLKYSSPN